MNVNELTIEADRRHERQQELIRAVTDIAVAAIGHNRIAGTDINTFLADTYATLSGLGTAPQPAEPMKPQPAVNPKRSVFDDHIVCLEDGKKFKSLKRHLMSHYNLTPEAYRERWGLSPDYPMVAPNYAAARSDLAKKMGLGRKPGRANGHRVAA